MNEDVHRKPTKVGAKIPVFEEAIPPLEAYSIKREIGRGGMAVVYEAVEKSLNRTVALKVLSKELSKDTDLIKRFVNEAQAAARLSHPNIVQIYSIGEEKGFYYFAMEYVRGKSVEGMLEDGKRIPILEAIGIVRQTALALQEAYKNNIVHRDIKPGNILVTEQGIVKVADFGLAGEIKGTPEVTGGKIIGTPLYISPEQAQGKGGDYRSDMYSLGITFYQMLTGRTPFMSSDTKVLIKSHIEKPIPQLPRDVPIYIKRIIYRMTDKNPDKRFPDYESLIKELDKAYSILTRKRYTLPILSAGLVLSIGITIYSFYYKPMVGELIIPVEIEKDKRIEAIYMNVVEYARKHPEAYGDVIKEYFKIIKEYPDTEWAYRAEQKIDMIIIAVAKEAAEELKGLKVVRDRLINEARYKEAVDKYTVIKNKYKDTAAESFAQENIDYIIGEARKDFFKRVEQAKEFINQHNFNEARKVYEEVINSYGLEEFVKEAKEKISFINELENHWNLETEAKKIFEPVQKEIRGLLDEHRYNEARTLLEKIKPQEQNPVLAELVKGELARIDKMQIEYESTVLKEKMEEQRNLFNQINKKAEELISLYKYEDAFLVVKEGINTIEVTEWQKNLEVLKERLEYLTAFKKGIIDGINKELLDKKVTNISANTESLILFMDGGYIVVLWKDVLPEKIYEIGQKYLTDKPEGHMALGVFCLTNGLLDPARKEFTVVLKMAPQMHGVVEKYLVELADRRE